MDSCNCFTYFQSKPMQNIFQITHKIKYTEDNLNKASHTNYFLTKQSNQVLWL